MEASEARVRSLVTERLRRELDIVHEAVLLVARGGASRAEVVGLRFIQALLAEADAAAREHGLRIRRLWSTDESALDLVVERAA
jgi:hypothetical protein